MPDLVERLREYKTFQAIPQEEVAWLVAHGTVRQYAEGVILAKGMRVDAMFIILDGHVGVFADRATGRRKISDWRPGDVSGLLPYSRLVISQVESLALEPTTVLEIHRNDLPDMIVRCQQLTAMLVHGMVDRSRDYTSFGLHDEKMVSLGKLSAGLAHELNNPVSAIARNAALLESRLDDVERAVGTLDASVLTAAQRASIAAARAACAAACPVLSPIEQADREDAIANWLAAHGVGAALVGPLADTAITLDALEPLGASLRGPQLEAVLRWVAAGHALRELAVDIREAALRIAGLVDAVKGFTQMDQAGTAEAVDVAEGLANTVAMFGAKAHAKSAVIAVDVPADMPRVLAFAGELNQIWANLLDNALDAVTDSGRIDLIARREPRRVVVQVIDNGSGIPPEIRPHIFDPFFTTKPVGQGTGLGLDIVGRLVGHNAAEIDVDSRPGRTAFTVSLPIAEASGAR